MEATPANATRVLAPLAAFGAPLEAVSADDFATPGIVFQMGLPPGESTFSRNSPP